MNTGLPIEEVLPALRAALKMHSAVVLQAPPGAGKSTVVPLVLLQEPWAQDKRLLMLEPRRLAARAVAQRMAHSLRERVGDTVGYRMRLDTRVSKQTRLEVITEGVLTRMLQSDPALEGVAAVLFDEFHERSLQADLGLALTLDARENLRPDLKVLLMSATLDGAAVAKLLGEAPIISSSGRTFPVSVRYAGSGAALLPGFQGQNARAPQDAPERLIARIVQRALQEEEGDMLVFLPGAREIRRVQSHLESQKGLRIFPLFGDLSAADQDAALSPGLPGTRRIVLATNIAETSLTIEGVRIVVDSGLVKRSQFDPATGMSRLDTERISRASAEQRCGRAGRMAPGVCYRAWSEGAHRSLAPFTPPEILSADLAPLALDLAGWGVTDAAHLRWLDAPPAAQLASAQDLLMRLGALDREKRITPHGKEMTQLSVHPRLAHMLLRARDLNCAPLAAQLAALLSERDVLRGAQDVDIRSRLELLKDAHTFHVDRATLQRIQRTSRDLLRQLERRQDDTFRDSNAKLPAEPPSLTQLLNEGKAVTEAGTLLAFAFPDRIGKARDGASGCYTLANGRGACFAGVQSLAQQEFIVAVDLDDRDRDARILLAAPLERRALEAHFAAQLERCDLIEWNPREQAVLARRTVRLDALTLEDKPLPNPSPEATRVALLQGVRSLGLEALNWTRDARDLQARMEFVRQFPTATASANWPIAQDAALLESLETWLAPWVEGMTRREHLARLNLVEALRAHLTWEQQRRLDELAPQTLQMPSGSHIRIDYLDEHAPSVSVRLQEVFGLSETPRIGGGRVPVTFKLLSPAQRPVQVTKDLASFWRSGYAQVRKDLRGRYPKHYWPEDPLEAEATRHVRPRR